MMKKLLILSAIVFSIGISAQKYKFEFSYYTYTVDGVTTPKIAKTTKATFNDLGDIKSLFVEYDGKRYIYDVDGEVTRAKDQNGLDYIEFKAFDKSGKFHLIRLFHNYLFVANTDGAAGFSK